MIHKGGLYKTTSFGNPKYVGDPINAVRIFNEKEVDELIVLDIDASRQKKEPDYSMISNWPRNVICHFAMVGVLKLWNKLNV